MEGFQVKERWKAFSNGSLRLFKTEEWATSFVWRFWSGFGNFTDMVFNVADCICMHICCLWHKLVEYSVFTLLSSLGFHPQFQVWSLNTSDFAIFMTQTLRFQHMDFHHFIFFKIMFTRNLNLVFFFHFQP